MIMAGFRAAITHKYSLSQSNPEIKPFELYFTKLCNPKKLEKPFTPLEPSKNMGKTTPPIKNPTNERQLPTAQRLQTGAGSIGTRLGAMGVAHHQGQSVTVESKSGGWIIESLPPKKNLVSFVETGFPQVSPARRFAKRCLLSFFGTKTEKFSNQIFGSVNKLLRMQKRENFEKFEMGWEVLELKQKGRKFFEATDCVKLWCLTSGCSVYSPNHWASAEGNDALIPALSPQFLDFVLIIISSWWFQPIWKILVKMEIFPK